MTSTAISQSDRLSLGRLLRAGAIAAAGAIVANVIFFLILSALGVTITLPAEMGGQLTVAPVIISTLVGAIGATAVLAALIRFTSNPARLFLIISAVFLVLSFGGPISNPGIDGTGKILLNVMHIIAAAVIVPTLISQSRAR
jgi:hypothetical protein